MGSVKRCAKCGFRKKLDSHHIVPKSKGGNDDKSNLIDICVDCHYKEHNPAWEDGDLKQFEKTYQEAIDRNVFSDGWGIIPNKVLRDSKISNLSKLLYCDISSLCAQKGYCFASNAYFAELFKVSIRTITRSMVELEKYVIFKNRASNRRRIYVHMLNQPRHGCLGTKTGVSRKVDTGGSHNNNKYNNDKDIIISKKVYKDGKRLTLFDGTKALKYYGNWVDAGRHDVKLDLGHYKELIGK